MSRLLKIGMILAAAAVLIAAKSFRPASPPDSVVPAVGASISPHEIMRKSGPLGELVVDNYY
jgi:hypothetical protein